MASGGVPYQNLPEEGEITHSAPGELHNAACCYTRLGLAFGAFSC